MNCPTCSHEMQSIGYANGGTIWHCSHCGTTSHLNHFGDGPPEVRVPALVERCRELRAEMAVSGLMDDYMAAMWERNGVTEAIGRQE